MGRVIISFAKLTFTLPICSLYYKEVIFINLRKSVENRQQIELPQEEVLSALMNNPQQAVFGNDTVIANTTSEKPDNITISVVENGFIVTAHYSLANIKFEYVALDLDNVFKIISTLFNNNKEVDKQE